jgi:flagellar hook-associated protein 2
LGELSKRGINGGEDGPLAGDPLVRSIQNRMRSLTTEPIEGYGDDAVYLATFGLETQRDGSITLDEDVFAAAFDENPAAFNAIIKNSITSSNNTIDASVIGDSWTGGAYALAIDDDGNATIDEADMSLLAGTYRISEGGANGLRLDVPAGVTSATIYMGRSLVSNLQSFAETLLARNNDIDTVIDRYNDDISDYDDQLAVLDSRMTAVRERYITQFMAMESLVASLNNTKVGLNNMMDAWRGSMND